MTELPALTDEQRATIIEFFKTNPEGGYKSAVKAAGILRLTKHEARALVEADPDLADVREHALGVDEDSAWKRLATIANDLEHKDALRANTFILGAIHGRSETSKLELTGKDGGSLEVNSPDVAAAVDRFTTLTVAAVRAAERTGPSASAPDTPAD